MMNMKSNKKFVETKKFLYGEDYERFDQMGRQSDLDGMAKYLGLAELYVKDESYRSASTPSRCWAAPLPWRATSPSRWAATSRR